MTTCPSGDSVIEAALRLGHGKSVDASERQRWAEAAHLAMRGRKRSGRSMVLAMPMTARREPLRVGHSMRLYNTCTERRHVANIYSEA